MIDIQENVALCSRRMLTSIMDSNSLKRQCSDIPGCNPCHVCDPDSDMAVLARQAIVTPLPPKPIPGFISAAAMLPPATHAGPSAPPSIARSRYLEPSSDDFGSEIFTPSMADAIDAVEQSFQSASTTAVGTSQSHPSMPVAR
jgi:hypothetical protein